MKYNYPKVPIFVTNGMIWHMNHHNYPEPYHVPLLRNSSALRAHYYYTSTSQTHILQFPIFLAIL
jgi:hypothetical protein